MNGTLASRRSLRLRLTLTYTVLFFVGGIALISITYLLMAHVQPQLQLGVIPEPSGDSTTPQFDAESLIQLDAIRASVENQRQADLERFLLWAGIALAITTAAAAGAGWFFAGKALKPLRTMTATAQEISQHNLHERLDASGPRDEVRDLADTINDLLARIQSAFDAQGRFVAYASHELRTPLTWDRTLIEVTLADPDADTTSLRSAHEELLTSVEDKERLIEALLVLATSERGLSTVKRFDISEIVDEVLNRARSAGAEADVTIVPRTEKVDVEGNPELIRRLVENVLDNAIRYNVRGGRVELDQHVSGDRVTLVIANTGPALANSDLSRILEPFQRLDTARTSDSRGHGLGLSIVQAIVAAHGGTLSVCARDSGGLIVTADLPRASRGSAGARTASSNPRPRSSTA